MTKIIGITGLKRHGKNTVADLIQKNWPAGPVKDVGFADKVKIAGMKALGFDRSDEELVALANEAKEFWTIDIFSSDTPDNINSKRPEAAFHDLSGREFLQWVGTEVGREMFGKDFWVDQVLPRREATINVKVDLEARYPGVDLLTISDLRFPNEAQRVLDCGGEVWRVVRYPGLSTGDTHASEQPLSEQYVTRTIHNDGTLDDLDERVAVELANMAAGYKAPVAA